MKEIVMKILINAAAYANTPPQPGQVYLSTSQVALRLGLSRTTIWRRLKDDPTFPQPLKFGPVTRRWGLASIEAWANRDANQ